MRELIKDYLTFTKKERTGIFIILFLILSGIIIPFIFEKLYSSEETDIKNLRSKINLINKNKADSNHQTFETKKSYREPKNVYNPSDATPIRLFDFDPNTASVIDWIKLGVREKTALTIQKYLSKGGHFYRPADISKIYGLHESDIKRLLPYVKIKNTSPVLVTQSNSFKKSSKLLEPYRSKKTGTHININTADSLELMTLPGIGVGYARRIIHFREKLGGFYSIEQIKETYGLPDSTYLLIKNKIYTGAGVVEKLDLNKSTLEVLRSHPYIKYRIANAIVQFREQHGKFTDINDLKKIMIIDDGLFLKIKEYLKVD